MRTRNRQHIGNYLLIVALSMVSFMLIGATCSDCKVTKTAYATTAGSPITTGAIRVFARVPIDAKNTYSIAWSFTSTGLATFPIDVTIEYETGFLSAGAVVWQDPIGVDSVIRVLGTTPQIGIYEMPVPPSEFMRLKVTNSGDPLDITALVIQSQ